MSSLESSRRTFPDEIVDALRTRILKNEFVPGEYLPPERELAVTLGTNRNTLREALRSLEAQGLVHARQGDGVRVLDYRHTADMSLLAYYLRVARPEEQPAIVSDLLRLRSIVAREVTRRAAELAEPEDIANLQACLTALERVFGAADLTHARADAHEPAVASNDPLAMVRPELAMYRTVIVGGKSLASLWLFNSLEKIILGLCEAFPGIWLTPSCYLSEWRAIVRSIAHHQADEAEAAMSRLLAATDVLVNSLFKALRALPVEDKAEAPPGAAPQPAD